MPPPPNKKVGPSVVVETSTNETAPLLVSDGTLQMDGMADDQIGGRPKRPPPSALFYATTSWVLFLEGLSMCRTRTPCSATAGAPISSSLASSAPQLGADVVVGRRGVARLL
eukprot:CAMPEP_0181344278 /NCGR_PEP_ID=MMETSP1101-20121128/32090_1 /TAXON_ID=46948 /ORGANISM="Rhodomonas abbreviata, Strain Caron Lab Isolate" /LENGTH=111 /DNA_ID=CAMNT_0023456075 /DNA_START=119 /DNA_END=452 /DNA_ORIENTATION=+